MKALSHIPEIVIWPFTARPLVKHGSAINNRQKFIEEYKVLGFHDTV
jgi:hypothetical protein